MRTIPLVVLLVLAPLPLLCQNTDVPVDLTLVSNSAVPNELYPGDQEQIRESMSLHHQPTISVALTNAGVWGTDEGPSLLLNDGRILWYWGDTVTAYQLGTSGNCAPPKWCEYQTSTCFSTPGDCLGVDTVSFISSADIANIATCNRLPTWDNNILSGTSTVSGACPMMTYITTHAAGTGIPLAGFTYNFVTGLGAGEDMMLGHTATGLFTLVDSSMVHHLYVNYVVESAPAAGGSIAFRTENILLRTAADTSTINSTTMPQLTKVTAFSQAPAMPQGAATASFNSGTRISTLTACLGTTFSSSWAMPSQFVGIFIAGSLFPVVSGSVSPTSMQVTGEVVGVTSCPMSGNNFDAVQNQDGIPGKFMFASPEILTTSLISTLGINSLLPTALQGVNIVCFWGSGSFYRNTNVYMGCMHASESNVMGSTYSSSSGLSNMYYLTSVDPNTGAPGWTVGTTSGAEAAAVPLLSSWTMNATTGGYTPCVGEQSVRWVAYLHRFLMTYGSQNCAGLWYRTASVPWGPWSAPSQLFSHSASANPWEPRIISPTGAMTSFNQQSIVEIVSPSTGSAFNIAANVPFGNSGNPYGAYQLPGGTATQNPDGTVTVYMNISGFNFYGSWLLGARFYPPPAVTIAPGVRVNAGVVFTHL